MRIPRRILYILFPAFICYYAAVAHAALQGKSVAPAAASLVSSIGQVVPRLALPETVAQRIRDAAHDLRQTVMDSAIMRDSRPSAEQERRDFVALWADLERPNPGLSAAVESDPAYPALVPGQD